MLEVSLAVNRDMAPGRAAMGEQQEVDWVRLVAWGRVAESMAQRARKGSRVMVVGAITTSSWTDKYGQNRSDVKVRCWGVRGWWGACGWVSIGLIRILTARIIHPYIHKQVRVKRAEVLQSNRAPANPELKYYQGWDANEGQQGGGGGGGGVAAYDDGGAAASYGGGYQTMRGGGGGNNSPYARRGGGGGGGSPYAKKKSGGWSSNGMGGGGGGGRQYGGYGGGGGGGGGGYGGGMQQQQQQPMQTTSAQEPPPYDAVQEFEMDTDIPF